jgi:hypothetical protein
LGGSKDGLCELGRLIERYAAGEALEIVGLELQRDDAPLDGGVLGAISRAL